MKKILVCAAMALGFSIMQPTYAQQAIFGEVPIVSPEIHDDNSVTFRVKASTAEEVKLLGDWMPPQGWTPGSADLTKDENGVWSFTTAPLTSDLYTYSLLVDSVRVIDPSNPHVIRDVANLFNVFIIGDGKGDNYKVKDVPHGSVTRRWYNSPSLEKQRRITIYTPPGYETSTEKLPVLYLLHGAGGDEEAWIALGRTSQILDNLIAEGKAEPMIVVMTNGNVDQQAAPGESPTGYITPQFMLPSTMNGKFVETFPDVIDFVESNYRVKADKAHRAIAGLSMGGFHTMHISRFHPNTFDYVALFSAAIMPRDASASPVFADIEGTLKQQKENGYKMYWIGIGKSDFLFEANTQFRGMLDGMDMKYEYMETEGGHTWTNWRVYLTEIAPKLFK